MKKLGSRIVKLAELKSNMFVRTRLDQDHVFGLAELIENGVALNPIQVTEDLILVDGRHRKEAYELHQVTETDAEVLSFENESELIAYAFRANCGGSKPPTMKDTEHTVQLLVERNESVKAIAEHLSLPVSMIRKYVENVKSRLTRQKLQQARQAVAEGAKIQEAATGYGVDVKTLKDLLSGTTSKRKKTEIDQTRRDLTKLYKSNGQRTANVLRALLDSYSEGDASEEQVREVFKHIEGHQRTHARATKDWMSRFEVLVQSNRAAHAKKTA